MDSQWRTRWSAIDESGGGIIGYANLSWSDRLGRGTIGYANISWCGDIVDDGYDNTSWCNGTIDDDG